MSNQNEHLICMKIVKEISDKCKFINLPTATEELEQQIQDFVGMEKYSITFNKAISTRHLELFEINELAKRLEHYDIPLVEALYECIGYVEDTVICLEEGYFQYSNNVSDLLDIAYEMVELGLLGNLSEEVLSYIDYPKIARELAQQGWRIHNNIAVLAY